MNLLQLRIYAVRPVLKELSLWSETSENLVLGTGLIESNNYEFIDQDNRPDGPGPAYGFFQMEAFTYKDIWNNYLSARLPLRTLVRDLAGHSNFSIPPVEDLRTNIALAIAMCRVHYYRVPAPLPANEPSALAYYWKLYYNTPLGSGSVDHAASCFQRVCFS